ncbi:probable LRR receptor-like serine/threonine-protein kinase At4g29180 [Cryptomeria japonica]|uniref:probable LRR receptor-like serine/threonine-protein kinase At4g29180 n=1 Tax=Cryptomeria japonica TaxID=3369 RepID=UPI0027DA9C2B|nr:probable LRR receptor-like serine/threonine-protein kinase At4g29180 [Cryptomeria japonica]XP_059071623.1 probable LRR receptor-like serine/threonine-protein kinase At4g29180 [Cryptomeria japonica]
MISIKQISGELAFNGLQAAEGEKIVYGEDVNVQQTEKLLITIEKFFRGSILMVQVVLLIIWWRIAFVIAQPGFLSINCGGKSNYTDENNIEWVPDDNYIEVGQKEEIKNSSLPLYEQSLRVFPQPLNKSCYKLPITRNVPHLVRIWFYNGNYSGQPDLPIFKFSIETTGMLALRNISNRITQHNVSSEGILVSSGDVLFICLIRISEIVSPFITAIELRTLRQGMYPQVKPGTMLQMEARYDPGGNSTIRYPQDQFDRLWNPLNIPGAQNVMMQETISTDATQDLPPSAVMQTAAVAPDGTNIIDMTFPQISNPLVLMYFAEIEMVNASESRSFRVLEADGNMLENISLARNFSATEVSFTFVGTNLSLYNLPNSGSPPLINAFEYYQLITTEPATYTGDAVALASLKQRFPINNWISDPCFGLPWEGILCNNSISSVRVSEINLSGRNLTGSLPTALAQMTELINILIDNNNFSGVIAQRFLNQISITYKGNPYLSILSQNSTQSNSKKSNVGVISGIISGGIIIIIVILAVSIVVYRRKFRRKDIANRDSKGNASGSKSVYLQDPDYSMVLVPNPSKSRAFTLEEMMIATKEFSCKIGQGGFGSVFWGKLEDEKQIAVKVLSSFSNQGASEFLNEIDLLSRVHHKNLVSLLGYCNESRALMLVYEYMLGGSLKDHLYGTSAEQYPNLDWKNRLNIALDAARGLEYLHVSCTPKIIHRDIKTANILLDDKLNGKLADFGLSRVTIDGEASHVTTTVKGTVGYLDPEYFKTYMLTDKTDIYSFGVILLEIICGRAPVDAKVSSDEINLVRWVTPVLEMAEYPERIVEIVDKRLVDDYSLKSIAHVAKLAIRCVGDKPSSRPSASEVLVEMKMAVQYHASSVDLSEEIDIDYRD